MDHEKMKKMMDSMSQIGNSLLDSFIPKSAQKHFRSACKEVLLGLIEIIDQDDLKQDDTPTQKENSKPKSHKIDIID